MKENMTNCVIIFLLITLFFPYSGLCQSLPEVIPAESLPLLPPPIEKTLSEIEQEMKVNVLLCDLESLNNLLNQMNQGSYPIDSTYILLKYKLLVYTGRYIEAQKLLDAEVKENLGNNGIDWPIDLQNPVRSSVQVHSIILLQPDNAELQSLNMICWMMVDSEEALIRYNQLSENVKKALPPIIEECIQLTQGNLIFYYNSLKNDFQKLEHNKGFNKNNFVAVSERLFNICLVLEKYNEAATILEKLKKYNPENNTMYLIYDATSQIYQKNFQQARAILDSIDSENKKQNNAYKLASALLDLSQGNYANAQLICKELIAFPEYKRYALVIRAEILLRTGKVELGKSLYSYISYPYPDYTLANMLLKKYLIKRMGELSNPNNVEGFNVSLENSQINWGVFPINTMRGKVPNYMPKKDYIFD